MRGMRKDSTCFPMTPYKCPTRKILPGMSKDVGYLACLEAGAIKLPGGCSQDSVGPFSLKEPSSEVNRARGRPGPGAPPGGQNLEQM